MFDQGMGGGITRNHEAVHEAQERTVVRLHRAPIMLKPGQLLPKGAKIVKHPAAAF